MRIIQMHPDKFPLPRAAFHQPSFGAAHHVHSAPLQADVARGRFGQMGRKGVEVIEAAVETRRRGFVQNDRANKRRRRVPVLFHDLDQSARLGSERHTKSRDSVGAGQQTAHDTSVRSVGVGLSPGVRQTVKTLSAVVPWAETNG